MVLLGLVLDELLLDELILDEPLLDELLLDEPLLLELLGPPGPVIGIEPLPELLSEGMDGGPLEELVELLGKDGGPLEELEELLGKGGGLLGGDGALLENDTLPVELKLLELMFLPFRW